MNGRWIVAALTAALTAELWLSEDGFRKTRDLREAVVAQRAVNAELKARNAVLDAEVVNLKEGREATEERARTDLGLIGENETFYQVVDTAGD